VKYPKGEQAEPQSSSSNPEREEERMSGTVKKVADVAFKAGKTIDWEGMAKLIVSDEARKEFATLRRAFDEVNSALQTKFSQVLSISPSLTHILFPNLVFALSPFSLSVFVRRLGFAVSYVYLTDLRSLAF